MRVWTSAHTIRDTKIEFCSIINEIIRDDDKEKMKQTVKFCRVVNTLLVNRQKDKVWSNAKWPKDNVLYRGGGLPDDKRGFFSAGKIYRVPMFLATSKNKVVSKNTFCKRAFDRDEPPVLWKFHLNEESKCVHVNYIDKTNVPGEDEFLFVPYSVFTVRSPPIWKENPTWVDPHVVEVDVAIDNTFHNKDVLPLAPWA
jgi:hypothetical protein